MKKIFQFLTNKYFLATVFFLVWILFFDQRDFFQQRERQSELQKLETKKAYYQAEIQKTQAELDALQNNPETREKYAREKYGMKKEGEDIFLVEDSSQKAPATK